MAKSFQNIQPITRLFKLIQLEKSDIKNLVLLTVCIGVLSLATPIAIQALVNFVTMGGLLEPLFIISFMLFIILTLSGSLYVLERYLVELIQRRFFVRTAIETAKKMQASKVEIQDHHNSVELINRFFDVITIQKSSATLLTYGLAATLQGIIGSIVLVFYSFYFAIVIAIVLVVIYFLITSIGKHASDTAIEESKSKYAVAAWLESIARNIITFKFLGGNTLGMQRADALSNDYLEYRKSHFHTLLIQNIFSIFIYASAGTAMLGLGGALVIKGQINLGEFVAAELIIFNVLSAYRKFIEYLEYYYDLIAAVDKVGILDDLPQESNGQNSIDLSKGLTVNAHEVNYQYLPNIPCMEQFNFQAFPGTSIAIVGASGAGKSTIANLLLGLRTPTTGHIQYNGVDIRDLDLNKMREHIAFIGPARILEVSILENIRLGHTEIDISTVGEVLKSLNLYESISQLKEGLNTILTASGAPFSTAQLQLLMIARAHLTKPKLLVIDELLDNLDQESLALACKLLNEHANLTTLIVFTRKEEVASYFAKKIMI